MDLKKKCLEKLTQINTKKHFIFIHTNQLVLIKLSCVHNFNGTHFGGFDFNRDHLR